MTYHEDSRCGSCRGPLEVHRDAVCETCVPESGYFEACRRAETERGCVRGSGLWIGLLLSMPIWALIIGGAYWIWTLVKR